MYAPTQGGAFLTEVTTAFHNQKKKPSSSINSKTKLMSGSKLPPILSPKNKTHSANLAKEMMNTLKKSSSVMNIFNKGVNYDFKY